MRQFTLKLRSCNTAFNKAINGRLFTRLLFLVRLNMKRQIYVERNISWLILLEIKEYHTSFERSTVAF
ncbi:unnamed protein product [Trichobilharzia szidati]|nr:unnamed protein product [Trichobilharzia szidati]